jgi:hypothetical protein
MARIVADASPGTSSILQSHIQILSARIAGRVQALELLVEAFGYRRRRKQ